MITNSPITLDHILQASKYYSGAALLIVSGRYGENFSRFGKQIFVIDWYMTRNDISPIAYTRSRCDTFPDLSANVGDIEGEPAGLRLEFLGGLSTL
jgi:hypothetical protein